MTSSRLVLVCRPLGTASLLAALVAAGGAAGCASNNPSYFPGGTVLEVMGGEEQPARATLQLQFRVPNDVEQRQRQMESDRLGYEVPWLREDRVHVEILYAVTNQDDRDGMFTVGLDGASEFTRYDQAEIAAAFEAAGEDPVLISLVQMKPEELGAGKTFKGTIREDDLHEASLDIDAMGRFMAPFAAVLINRSEVDPVGLEIVPPNNAPECLGTRIPCTGNTGAVFYAPTLIRPALWELTVNFVADRRMRLEFLARVRDDDSRLLEEGQQAFTPDPATFTPEVTMM